jgi:hypothetical protein
LSELELCQSPTRASGAQQPRQSNFDFYKLSLDFVQVEELLDLTDAPAGRLESFLL